MGDIQNAVSDMEELWLRRQLEREVIPNVVADRAAFDSFRTLCQAISEGVAPGTPPGTKKRDLAEERRAWFEAWYRSLWFKTRVPKPNVTNREFARRTKKRQALVYRPASTKICYEAFMTAVGQGDDWTVRHQDARAAIGWEPTATGYWFWADAGDKCPRRETTWNDLTNEIRLLSLEEYVILWHAVDADVPPKALLAPRSLGKVGAKAETGRMLDVHEWNLLRTRFGPGALCASPYDGHVRVRNLSAVDLMDRSYMRGGRAMDPIPALTGAGSH